MKFDSRLQARDVMAGKKSQHRVPVREGKAGAPRARCLYRAGNEYPVEGPNGPIGLIQVEKVGLQVLGAVTRAEARSEGYRNELEFRDAWLWRHDRRWAEEDQDPDTGLLQTAAIRWEDRWVSEEVWVLELKATDTAWLLTPASRPGGTTRGYTTDPRRAMLGEPETVDGPTLEQFARESEARFREHRGEELKRRKVKRVKRLVSEVQDEAVLDEIENLISSKQSEEPLK